MAETVEGRRSVEGRAHRYACPGHRAGIVMSPKLRAHGSELHGPPKPRRPISRRAKREMTPRLPYRHLWSLLMVPAVGRAPQPDDPIQYCLDCLGSSFPRRSWGRPLESRLPTSELRTLPRTLQPRARQYQKMRKGRNPNPPPITQRLGRRRPSRRKGRIPASGVRVRPCLRHRVPSRDGAAVPPECREAAMPHGRPGRGSWRT